MAKVFFPVNNVTRAIVQLRTHGQGVASPAQAISDGDTIGVRADGDFGVRLLGVDAPEKSLPLPGTDAFVSLKDERWQTLLTDPFGSGIPEFEPPLDDALAEHLRKSAGANAAQNHRRHGEVAEDVFEDLVVRDIQTLSQTGEDFHFFLSFAMELTDAYGRLLCFINRNQPHATQPEPRPPSYNERMMEMGIVNPYLIWPNVNPFLGHSSLLNAVIVPGTANDLAESDSRLRAARSLVKTARQAGKGLFEPDDPLQFEAFEVRMISRRRPPRRWVIDLSRNDSTLLKPSHYFEIPNPEDRLFIPDHFVPLFVERGWQRQS